MKNCRQVTKLLLRMDIAFSWCCNVTGPALQLSMQNQQTAAQGFLMPLVSFQVSELSRLMGSSGGAEPAQCKWQWKMESMVHLRSGNSSNQT